METIDWSRFVVRINVNAPVEKLYHGWVTRSGIEYWFLRKSEYKNPDGSIKSSEEFVNNGDTYTWYWHGYPDSVKEEGEILETNGKDYFQFRFGKAGICTVKIKQELGETIVEMEQSEIPTDEKGMHNYHVGCKTGWTFHFTNMKSIFEGGKDLRNKREDLKEMLNS